MEGNLGTAASVGFIASEEDRDLFRVDFGSETSGDDPTGILPLHPRDSQGREVQVRVYRKMKCPSRGRFSLSYHWRYRSGRLAGRCRARERDVSPAQGLHNDGVGWLGLRRIRQRDT